MLLLNTIAFSPGVELPTDHTTAALNHARTLAAIAAEDAQGWFARRSPLVNVIFAPMNEANSIEDYVQFVCASL
jgi:hypothetical protein